MNCYRIWCFWVSVCPVSWVLGCEDVTMLQLESGKHLQSTQSDSDKAPILVHRSHHIDAAKFRWLHVPKTGTSFGNVMYTYYCKDLPDNVSYPALWKDCLDETSLVKYKCENGMIPDIGHMSIVDAPEYMGDDYNWDEHKGYFATMLRQPEQRIISGYFHNMHSYGFRVNGSTVKSLDHDGPDDIQKYAQAVAGCSVKMMNGLMCGNLHARGGQANLAKGLPTSDLVETAIERLKVGFAFVGLTEQWDLSVCLFHAMFGGRCHNREFFNNRPCESDECVRNAVSEYSAQEVLGDFVDPYDGALYAAGKELFERNLRDYDVNTLTCKSRICRDWQEPFTELSQL